MKSSRAVIAITALLVAVLLTACGSPSPTPPAPTPLPEEEAKLSDSVGLAYDPASGSLLRADQQGLFRWLPATGWAQVEAPGSASLSAVAVNPKDPSIVFASGRNLGVIRSDDGGESWSAVNYGLPSLDVTALAIHSFQRETVFAWLAGAGVYRTEDGGESWLRMPDPGPPDSDVRGLVHSTLTGSMNTGWLYAATPTGAYLSMDCF